MRNMLPSLSSTLGLAMAVFASDPCDAATPTLKTLVSFGGDDYYGREPFSGVIADGNGNLWGTTAVGGYDKLGTVFEVGKTEHGYDITFSLAFGGGDDAADPYAGLIADTNGNLFGTTYGGGRYDGGVVFEVFSSRRSGAILYTFCSQPSCADGEKPLGELILDAAGNLFGTTQFGGASNRGTVFAITPQGVDSTLTTLVSFGAFAGSPTGRLIADRAGNLIGAADGGLNGDGTLFEVAKTAAGYASTPTFLVSFTGADGKNPNGGLIADGNGNLFGTTLAGGANGMGTVFMLATNPQNPAGYASVPTTLVSFTGADGKNPNGGLIADANGNLFGTTQSGGANGTGTVFEIAKTPEGYASTPTILVSFGRFANDPHAPTAGLIADRAGNLFGTTAAGGVYGNVFGTVFEVTDSGFVPSQALTLAGKPGKGDCYGESVLALRQTNPNLDAAAQARGLDNAEALQAAILHYCRRS
jgi:uncharacterized repeat protein (TIGR03803 family)